MSYVWGVAFSKDIGAEKTPRSNSARVVSVAYALLALIMVNTYCANLMAFLLQEPYILPISGVRDAKVGKVYSKDLVHLRATELAVFEIRQIEDRVFLEAFVILRGS